MVLHVYRCHTVQASPQTFDSETVRQWRNTLENPFCKWLWGWKVQEEISPRHWHPDKMSIDTYTCTVWITMWTLHTIQGQNNAESAQHWAIVENDYPYSSQIVLNIRYIFNHIHVHGNKLIVCVWLQILHLICVQTNKLPTPYSQIILSLVPDICKNTQQMSGSLLAFLHLCLVSNFFTPSILN